jgi:hypothetical protein
MAEEVKKGLLAIWVNVDTDFRAHFQKWLNCEHIPERVRIPGVSAGLRYQKVGESIDFLMCYETDDASVMRSEQYLYAVNNPSPWTKDTMTHSRVIARAIYQLTAFAGERPSIEAPYVIAKRFDLDPVNEDQFIKWYGDVQLPKTCELPGVYCGSLYRINEEVSHMQTTERKIHGGGPTQQKFLALYRTASLDLSERRDWLALNSSHADENLGITEVQDELYWLDFVMRAPTVPVDQLGPV